MITYTLKKILILFLVLGTAQFAGAKPSPSQEHKALCTALETVLSSAKDNFETIKGAQDSTDNFYTYYQTIMKIPATESCSVRKSEYGITYFCVEGTYKSGDKAQKGYLAWLTGMKACLPGYYFEKDTSEHDYSETLFGKLSEDGFDREAGSVRLVKKADKYQIYVMFEKGVRLHFIFNKSGNEHPVENFGTDLNRLLLSCKTGFKDQEDTLHRRGPEAGGSPKTRLTGSLETHLISSHYNARYESIFYKGTSENDARLKYNELLLQIKSNLPPSFVYAETSSEDHDIADTVFGNKISKSYDYIPAVHLRLINTGNSYQVALSISKENI
jgi:hypothetical protein